MIQGKKSLSSPCTCAAAGFPDRHQLAGPAAALDEAAELAAPRAVDHRRRDRGGAVALHRVHHDPDRLAAGAVGQADGEKAGGGEADPLLPRAGARGVDLLGERLVDPVFGGERRKVTGPAGPSEQRSGGEREQEVTDAVDDIGASGVGPGRKVTGRTVPAHHETPRPPGRSRGPPLVEP